MFACFLWLVGSSALPCLHNLVVSKATASNAISVAVLHSQNNRKHTVSVLVAKRGRWRGRVIVFACVVLELPLILL